MKIIFFGLVVDIHYECNYNRKSRYGNYVLSNYISINDYILFRSSSVVEHSAVNRAVVGSNPTCGAIFIWGSTQEAEEAPLLRV